MDGWDHDVYDRAREDKRSARTRRALLAFAAMLGFGYLAFRLMRTDHAWAMYASAVLSLLALGWMRLEVGPRGSRW